MTNAMAGDLTMVMIEDRLRVLETNAAGALPALRTYVA
jgi:hypothetical protein